MTARSEDEFTIPCSPPEDVLNKSLEDLDKPSGPKKLQMHYAQPKASDLAKPKRSHTLPMATLPMVRAVPPVLADNVKRIKTLQGLGPTLQPPPKQKEKISEEISRSATWGWLAASKKWLGKSWTTLLAATIVGTIGGIVFLFLRHNPVSNPMASTTPAAPATGSTISTPENTLPIPQPQPDAAEMPMIIPAQVPIEPAIPIAIQAPSEQAVRPTAVVPPTRPMRIAEKRSAVATPVATAEIVPSAMKFNKMIEEDH
ncbi:MAG: hypothetical protein FWD69_19370 [Polyangiaceae bacterium]|nr:hypothetical protein [Polyangiaceae bacterium]